MVSPQEQDKVVIWNAEIKSIVTIQIRFRRDAQTPKKNVRTAFERSPLKTLRKALRELEIPITFHRIVHCWLRPIC
ncbi:hypothetical protein C0J52_13821 [Blattella germanica]|nr:hypothetical protein C0J52_13821 [Blattella germanica]